MTIDWIDAPLLSHSIHSVTDWVAHGMRIMAAIGEIKGSGPVYLDIGSDKKWLHTVEIVGRKLDELVRMKHFKRVDKEAVGKLSIWAMSDEVMAMVTNNARLTHGDLKAGQVFMT